MMWTLHLDSDEYVVSMRSEKADVGEIAKRFGGGGHKFAAAFAFPVKKFHINDLFV
jgi:nanoRNase/pAp phosphatase (c-di-AMP/oligoRNAs hydrolase)